MKENLRFIVGYVVGLLIFGAFFPFLFIELFRFEYIPDYMLFETRIWRFVCFSFFFVAGVIFAVWSNIFLYKIGKGGPTDAFGVSVSPQTKKLVTAGPYHFSRNPMVSGTFLLYISLAIFVNSFKVLVAVIIFFILVYLFLKYSEEKRLIRDFGNDYMEYRKKVPMFFPFHTKHIRR